MLKRRRHTTRRMDALRSLLSEVLEPRCMLTGWIGGDACTDELADSELRMESTPHNDFADVRLDEPAVVDRGVDVSPIPVPLPKPAADDGSEIMKDHPGPGGNVALGGMTPDIQSEDLQPAPDYEAMTLCERSVVEIIARAIADEEYGAMLLSDVETALAGYAVTDDDRTALGVMPEESFDFFASEVEARLGEAMAGDTEPELLQQVVHAVWRDLNPGGLAYVLAYKIPNKHLK